MRKNGIFVLRCTGTVFSQFMTQLLHLRHVIWINSVSGVLLFFFFQLTDDLLALRFITATQRCLNLFRQALFEVLINLIRTGIENAVDTKIQFWAVYLENLAQFGNEFLEFSVFHCAHHSSLKMWFPGESAWFVKPHASAG